MGDEPDEANAMNDFERVKTENLLKHDQRDADLAEWRAAEAAKNQGQSSMTAGGTAAGWPDNEVHSAPGRLDAVAGALRVGKAGDAAFAKKLLDSGQAPAGGRGTPAGEQTDGAKARLSGALGVRGATPAVER